MQPLHTIMSSICSINSRCAKLISIAGGGLRGLNCAIFLLENKYEVKIYETRQEIGNPIRSPGIIKNLDPNMISACNAKSNDFGWGLRREWLEKMYAEKVVDLGGEIILKTEAPSDAIDCRGGKSPAPGWPSNNPKDKSLTVWRGGITIRNNVPKIFELNTMTEDKFCFEHSDGLVECWIRGELPTPTQGWLEIIQGEHPINANEIWADNSLLEGVMIAKKTIQSLQEGN